MLIAAVTCIAVEDVTVIGKDDKASFTITTQPLLIYKRTKPPSSNTVKVIILSKLLAASVNSLLCLTNAPPMGVPISDPSPRSIYRRPLTRAKSRMPNCSARAAGKRDTYAPLLIP